MQVTPDMVGVIRNISKLSREEPPCHRTAMCVGVLCGYLYQVDAYLQDLDSGNGDRRGYGEQIVNAALSYYLRISENRTGTSPCNVPGIYEEMYKLGSMAAPYEEL